MFHQENQILLIVGSSKSTSVSMTKPTGITVSASTFLQGLFIQYLHKAVNTIVSLQPSLHDNILRHLYKDISMIVSLLSSLLTSLWSEFLQFSLLTSLRSEFLQLSLLESLRSEFLQSSLLASLWNIFLRHLYEDISIDTSIDYHQNLKYFYRVYIQNLYTLLLQSIWKSMMLSKQIKH